MDYFETARKNQTRAWEIIKELDIVRAWENIGARINLVGSLKSGLLMKNRDIDFHIYTDELDIAKSFSVIEKLVLNPNLKRITYGNLIDTEEECIEWHAWYENPAGEKWQIDMIHIRGGSTYDGIVERVTEGILNILTPETKHTILKIKADTPDDIKIMGIEIYRAVLADGIRDYDGFMKWRDKNPYTGVFDWLP